MHSVPIIETDRLILRPYRRDDFPAYSALFGDAEVIRYVGGVPFTREQSWTRFLRQVGMWHYFGFGFFAIQDRETGVFSARPASTTCTAPSRLRSKGRWKPDGHCHRKRTARGWRRKPSVRRSSGPTTSFRSYARPASSTSETAPRSGSRRSTASRNSGERPITATT